MTLLLALVLAISCTKNETTPLSTEVTNDLKVYKQFENLMLKVGNEDLDAMFVHYLGFIIFSEEKAPLTINDLGTFENRYKEVTYTALLPQIAVYNAETAAQLAPMFENITRFSEVEERINFLALQLEREEMSSALHVLLGGYNNLLRKMPSNSTISYRDCESSCIDNNRDIWRGFYQLYCNRQIINPCTFFDFSHLPAINFANRELRAWCSRQCKEPCFQVVCPAGQKCVNGICRDNCYQIFCNPGYYCDDGTCIRDPFYEQCNSGTPCPLGQHCVEGFCQPF